MSITLTDTQNPRRKTVLADGQPIGTVEQVADGWLALLAGLPLGTFSGSYVAAQALKDAAQPQG